jgi:hypothetical protein
MLADRLARRGVPFRCLSRDTPVTPVPPSLNVNLTRVTGPSGKSVIAATVVTSVTLQFHFGLASSSSTSFDFICHG